MRQVLRLAADVVVGLVLAGVVAPLVLAVVPAPARGKAVLGLVCVVSIAAASMLRRFAVADVRRPPPRRP